MNFDPGCAGFTKTAQELEGREAYRVPTVDRGPIEVGQLREASGALTYMEAKHPDKGGALLTDTPSLAMLIDGKPLYLTWNEAYNLGWALIKVALVSLCG